MLLASCSWFGVNPKVASPESKTSKPKLCGTAACELFGVDMS